MLDGDNYNSEVLDGDIYNTEVLDGDNYYSEVGLNLLMGFKLIPLKIGYTTTIKTSIIHLKNL